MTDPIERIDALTRNARNTWFALLSALLFVGVTLMGVEHIDFYGVDRATQLPLIGVSVPTPLFFYAAPLLTTAIYCYFHLYLIRLWDALGSAPARVNSTRLGDAITPWLLTDAALYLRRVRRRDNCSAPRAMEGAAAVVNLTLTWGLGWVVLGFTWIQSLPARDLWMSQIAAASLALALVFGAASLTMAFQRLGRQTHVNPEEAHRIWSTVPAISGLLALLLVLPSLTWQKTSGRNDRLARLDLTGEALVEKPADWLPYDIARTEFRAIWCKREGIEDCSSLGQREEDFEDEWHRRFQARIAGLTKPKWSAPKAQRPNLRNAELTDTFFVGANLSGAQMQGARLWRAEMQGADLRGAEMQGARLIWAQMQDADLSGAQMQGAELFGAVMQGADLREAQMQNADLRGAQMQGADLRGAQMQGAELFGAVMQGADLRGAQMQGAELFGAVMQDAKLGAAQMQRANLGAAQLQDADLLWAQMQNADLGTAKMQGANLREAQMQGANLSGAQMQDARFTLSHLTGSKGHPISLEKTNLSASINSGGALRFVDLTGSIFDPQTDWRNVFLDGSVTWPFLFEKRMKSPCQWVDEVLSDEEFYGRWRGWIEQRLGPWPYSAPEGWEDVTPIPPPEGCTWKSGPMPHWHGGGR